jgi:alpha-mannosidase/mannosylglycerate hydrolase
MTCLFHKANRTRNSPMPPTMHVVSHTHWDREWVQPFEVFRARLVTCIDSMFDLMCRDPGYRFFHLDGQTSVLEDYLEIRPEREADLKALISEGRVLVGPWYTQPDEFLVSGEAMVRNLLLGTRMAHEFGGCMNIGYLPDAFGQTGQMPQIFAGFGFPAALIFRGITTDDVRAAFVWRGADGTAMTTIKMSDDDAYSNYLYRLKDTLSDAGPIDESRLAEELTRLRVDSEALAVCDQHLCMDGVDQIFPNPKTPGIIEFANRLMPDARIIHSTLPDYARALLDAQPQLNEVQGELRRANRAGRLNVLLANVASSHVRIKQANVRAQNALERVVEPLCSFAWLGGQPYPSSYLALAWKTLLENQAHDSICGCSVDQVHREMHGRYDRVKQITGVVQEQALDFMVSQLDTSFAGDDQTLVLYNPLPNPRRGTLVCEMPFPNHGNAPPDIVLHDSAGQAVAHQLLAVEDVARMYQQHYDIPYMAHRRNYTVALDVDLPSFGFGAFRISAGGSYGRSDDALYNGSPAIENEFLCARVEADGTLTLAHKPTGRVYHGLLALEDCGDGGEGWNWIPPRFDTVYLSPGSPVNVARIAHGPLYSALSVQVNFRVPEGFDTRPDEGDPARMKRSENMVELPVEFTLSLGARSEQLDIAVHLDNRARNHRLRVLFPTAIETEVCHADVAFDVIERPIRQRDSHGWSEPQLGTYPHQSFVCLGDSVGGLAVFTDGTMEYEVTDDARHAIAITLLRAFGRGAGEPHQYVDSQEQGERDYRLALRPFPGDWQQAGILPASREFCTAPLVRVEPAHAGPIQPGQPLLTVEGRGIDVTAVKHAEERDSIIVRCVNLTGQTQTVTLNAHTPVIEAHRLNLAEERESGLEVQVDGTVRLSLEPRQIATVEFVPKE